MNEPLIKLGPNIDDPDITYHSHAPTETPLVPMEARRMGRVARRLWRWRGAWLKRRLNRVLRTFQRSAAYRARVEAAVRKWAAELPENPAYDDRDQT